MNVSVCRPIITEHLRDSRQGLNTQFRWPTLRRQPLGGATKMLIGAQY